MRPDVQTKRNQKTMMNDNAWSGTLEEPGHRHLVPAVCGQICSGKPPQVNSSLKCPVSGGSVGSGQGMCSATIPNAGASKIMIVKAADQDGSLTTATMGIDSHSRHGFQSSAVLGDLETAPSQLAQTGDVAATSMREDQLQVSGTLMMTLPTQDVTRRELPPYSLLLYRPGPGSSMEQCPLILSTSSDGASMPVLPDILTSQSLAQPQVLVTTSAALASANPGSVSPSTHSVDPAWLQVLSNILSASSSDGSKGQEYVMNSSDVSETHHPPVGCISIPYPAFTTKTQGNGLRDTSLVKVEAALKIPLADLTNKLTTAQSQVAAHVRRDDVVALQPVSSHLDGRSCPDFFQVFVNKSQLDSKTKPSLTSSEEENQSANPHETMASTGHVIRLGINNLSQVSMPLLAHSSLSCHEESGPIRESHNLKERRRRARIKDACNLMRQLVPGMSHRTDKATVFEFSARYIHFLKSFVGSHNDKDFLLKYSPY